MSELISIVTPVYNAGRFLDRTIESVRKQTYTNWELILIDDCSDDDSRSIIEKYVVSDARIRSVFLNENAGAGVARNAGLDAARGEFIAFLDSDDFWEAEKLEIQYDFMVNHGAEISYTWYYNVGEDGTQKSYFRTPLKVSRSLLRFNNYILTSTLICSRRSIGSNRFSSVRKRQDWIFFLDLLRTVPFAYAVSRCLVNYTKSSKSLSSNKLALVRSNLNVIADYFYEGKYPNALFHFIVFMVFYGHNKIFNLRVPNDLSRR